MPVNLSLAGNTYRVLVVEENRLERLVTRHRLRHDEVTILEAEDGESAIALARSERPDLILLDVNLPDINGFTVVRYLKDDPITRSIPVIFLSDLDDTSLKVRGLDLGAVDYVIKPFDPDELRARIRVALRTKFYFDLLEQQANLDALTGLANRRALENRLAADCSACHRRGVPLSLLIIDLDHFKRINDGFGHAAGDETLRHVAEALRAVSRMGDLVARYGGEEFVIVAPDCELEGALIVAERVRVQIASLSIPFRQECIDVTASVGVASMPPATLGGNATPVCLLNHADLGLYEAKSAGRNTVRVGNHTLTKDLGRSVRLNYSLISASEANLFDNAMNPI